jgi:CRISPR-associated protein Csx17
MAGPSEESLLGFFLDDWRPSPILNPWNNHSGFYPSSKGNPAKGAMDALAMANLDRLAPLVQVIQAVRERVGARGYNDAPKDEEKAEFIAWLRGELPDEAVTWLDAVAVTDGQEVQMMPIVGSGGNEGVLDYSSLYLRSLVDTLLIERDRSESLLRAALFGRPTTALLERPGGQFDPGTAGGFNTGPGFETKLPPNNPWTFILLVEGALAWVSGLASRQQGAAAGYRLAVSPFTVRHRAAGYGSAGRDDDDPQRTRAEVWTPVWRRPATSAEVSRFIADGRVDVVRKDATVKRAANSLDFADAIASFGVDRGVSSFVRYTLIKRRGDSFIALPSGSLDVHYRREVDLLRDLAPELDVLDRFLGAFPSEQGPPAQLAGLRRAIDDARFDVSARGGATAVTRLFRAIGAMERELARRDPGKEPRLQRPLGNLKERWVTLCDDSTEVRLAAAVASIRATAGAAPLRAYVAPLAPPRYDRFAPAARAVAWVGASLPDRLANVLHRRLLDARAGLAQEVSLPGRDCNPTYGPRAASVDDVAAFLTPSLVDEALLEDLLFGFSWIDFGDHRGREWDDHTSQLPARLPLSRIYALLKLAFLPRGLPMDDGGYAEITADPSIVPLLRAGRLSTAVQTASRQLRVNGLSPRRVVDGRCLDDAQTGRRLAAALLIPVVPVGLKRAALLPPLEKRDADEEKEPTDAI